MATRITVVLEGIGQYNDFDCELTPEYYNEEYERACREGDTTVSFTDVDGDVFSFVPFKIIAISFVKV